MNSAEKEEYLREYEVLKKNGNTLGPELTEIGAKLPAAAIDRTIAVGPSFMPSYDLSAEEQRELVKFLASLQ